MTDSSQSERENTVTIRVPAFVRRWVLLIPQSTARAALLFFAAGVGLGLTVVVSNATISWYKDRPLPQKAWQEQKFDAVGLRAKLETDWGNSGDELKYKLLIGPSDPKGIDDFSRMLNERQFGGRITVNLFDARHFLVAKSDEYLSAFTRVLDDSGKVKAAVVQGKFFISRDQYTSLSNWDFSTNLPLIQKADGAGKPSSSGPQNINSLPGTGQTARVGTSKNGHMPVGGPQEGDEIISGYDIFTGNLETSSGRTFYIYKPGEQSSAIGWPVSTQFHYQCNETLVCTLTREGTAVILHAKLRK
ncbi:MAG: hypothetical protein ACLPM3_05770 [Terracidiphilus sp.]